MHLRSECWLEPDVLTRTGIYSFGSGLTWTARREAGGYTQERRIANTRAAKLVSKPIPWFTPFRIRFSPRTGASALGRAATSVRRALG